MINGVMREILFRGKRVDGALDADARSTKKGKR